MKSYAAVGVCLLAVSAGQAAVSLVPAPREVHWRGRDVHLAPGRVAIVVGSQASAPERSAADLLGRSVQRRFGQTWPIIEEGASTDASVQILAGCRASHQLLDRLCRSHDVELDAAKPGHDGYVIRTLEADGRLYVLLGGSEPRGVLYAQDTFFQLLKHRPDGVRLIAADVRDAPSIPWRGRPQTNVQLYLNPGEMDLYARSRINFIDLRNGTYAYEPGDTWDDALIRRILDEAHARGIIVYATINCGIPKSDHATVLKMYEQFIALGADGLWLSFDDKGPGEDPETLTRAVLELGGRHGIKDHLIAVTPPKRDYQQIRMPFNQHIMKIPGMERATWFWTCLPLSGALADARSIGMKSRPSWWHNWTRPNPGFTHPESGTYVIGKRLAYLEVPPLSEGWHAPTYEVLKDAAGSADAIMPWGGNGWGQYYVAPVIGWWGWAPERHDFEAVRGRIYDIVYGRGQVEAAREFDDALRKVKSLFRFVSNSSEFEPMCPARLRNPRSRPAAEALLARMRERFTRIESSAAKETMLEPSVLKEHYLDPMRAELETGEAAARLTYPEDWWLDHQREVLSAIYSDDLARADELIAKASPRVLQQVETVGQKLADLRPTAAYVEWWRDRASMKAIDWKKMVTDRRSLLEARVKDYNRRAAPTEEMLSGLAHPPLDWGTGRWESSNRVLATVMPSELEMFWGEWMAGIYRHGETEVAAFALNPKVLGTEGGFAELELAVPVSGDRQRLAILLYLSNENKETIGGDFVRNRMAGYRTVKLLWGDRILWQEDVGVHRVNGQWFMARLPLIPADLSELPLRLRVEDVKDTQKNFCIVFVGPIRLMELGGLRPE